MILRGLPCYRHALRKSKANPMVGQRLTESLPPGWPHKHLHALPFTSAGLFQTRAASRRAFARPATALFFGPFSFRCCILCLPK